MMVYKKGLGGREKMYRRIVAGAVGYGLLIQRIKTSNKVLGVKRGIFAVDFRLSRKT